jgi:hypothetical protein
MCRVFLQWVIEPGRGVSRATLSLGLARATAVRPREPGAPVGVAVPSGRTRASPGEYANLWSKPLMPSELSLDFNGIFRRIDRSNWT